MSFGLSIKNLGNSEGPIFILLYKNCELDHLSCFCLFGGCQKGQNQMCGPPLGKQGILCLSHMK